MKRWCACLLSVIVSVSVARAGNWPQWRGPAGTGVSEETGLPVRWSATGLDWTCPLPGTGASTPAIWGAAVFVTSEDGDKLLLHRIDKANGKIVWTRQVGSGQPDRGEGRKGPAARSKQKFHKLHDLASPSPITDGDLVIAHFGNGDLAAYDFAGKQLWLRNLQKDFGPYTIWWGHANSPVLYDDLVISVCMQDSLEDLGLEPASSYLVAHDKRSGAVKWQTPRKTQATAEECDSYTTPLLYRGKDRTELIAMGGNQIDGYDPATGKQLWYLPGILGGRTITGPTLNDAMVFATRGMRKPLLAVRLGGKGKLSENAVAWTAQQSTPDSPSPVAWKDWLFTVTDNGIAQCYEARTGTVLWSERLPQGDYKASPVAADGKLYFPNLKGVCTVLRAGPQFEKLAENALDDRFIASPAISDGRLFLRGDKALYCVGK